MNEKRAWENWPYLRLRGPISQEPPLEVEGVLIVGSVVASWEEDVREEGFDSVKIRPAFHDGNKVWVVSRSWIASPPYCAEGDEDDIISFEEGATLLLKHGAFEHLFK